MKPFRIAAIAASVLLIVAVGGIGLIAATFDTDRLKAELSRIVKEKKHRTLKIEGETSLSFFPSLGVKLGKVTLSEHESDDVFVALDSARVAVQVLPLLSKQFVVDRIELDGLRGTLIRHKDGSLNIDDLLSQQNNDSSMVKFDIAGVSVSNTQLGWRDEQAGQQLTLADFTLKADHLSNAASGGMSLSTHMMGEKPRLDATFKLAARYDYDLDQRRYSLAALDTALKGKQGADDFNIQLVAPTLRFGNDKVSGDSANLTLNLVGSGRNVTAKLVLSGIEGNAQSVKVGKLALDLDAKAGDASVKGTLASPLSIDPQAKTIALPRLTGSVDLAHPAMPMKQLTLPIAGRLKLDLEKQNAAAEITTQFDESHVRAGFRVSDFAPLALGFDLDVDRLNVDKYLPPAAANAAEGQATSGGDRIDLSALKSLNLNGTAQFGSLQIRNIKAANVRFNLKAAGGRLEIAPHSASLYEGSLAGSFSVDANGNRIVLKENLSGVRINTLLKDAIARDMVEGQGNVVLDLSAHGDTVSSIKKTLAGSARVSLRDGAIKGINLARSLRDLQARFAARQDAVQAANTDNKTDFSELSASFAIANGVAHNDDLAVKSPFLRLAGSGDVDIGNGAMNYLAKATVVGSAAGQGGAGLESLKGLTVPVRVSGPFDKLSYALEFGSMVQEAARARVEEKKQELQQKLQNSIKEKLKGIFGK